MDDSERLQFAIECSKSKFNKETENNKKRMDPFFLGSVMSSSDSDTESEEDF